MNQIAMTVAIPDEATAAEKVIVTVEIEIHIEIDLGLDQDKEEVVLGIAVTDPGNTGHKAEIEDRGPSREVVGPGHKIVGADRDRTREGVPIVTIEREASAIHMGVRDQGADVFQFHSKRLCIFTFLF